MMFRSRVTLERHRSWRRRHNSSYNKWWRPIADSDADCYANAKANTVSAPNAGAAPESGALKRTVSGNSSVTFLVKVRQVASPFRRRFCLPF
jgi:hypothetical protein